MGNGTPSYRLLSTCRGTDRFWCSRRALSLVYRLGAETSISLTRRACTAAFNADQYQSAPGTLCAQSGGQYGVDFDVQSYSRVVRLRT